MEIARFVVNLFGENTYIIYHGNECAVIDPGMSDADEEAAVTGFIERNGLQLKYILMTHEHVDHLFGVAMLRRRYPDVPVVGHKGDMALGQSAPGQAAMFHLRVNVEALTLDRLVDNGDRLPLGDEELTVIHTPGHSQGGVCYYASRSGFVVTGDTLFQGSIGRTDLPGGNYGQLIKSITERLLSLPDDTVVYPGHGDPTTIGAEKRNNPYL